jgi:sulfonate transport system substrate-binding protein
MSFSAIGRGLRHRRLMAAVAALLAGLLMAACGSSSGSATSGGSSAPSSGSANLSKVTLRFSFQTADYPALLKASGLFNNLPYHLQTPLINGAENEITALYSGAIDVGLAGENSVSFEMANASTNWAKTGPVLYSIAQGSYSNPSVPFGLFVQSSAGIHSLQDLKGKSIAYNVGGATFAAFANTLAIAGLNIKEVKPEQFTSNTAAVAAFVAGGADAVYTQYPLVAPQLTSGTAKLLETWDQLGVYSGGAGGYITSAKVLKDPGKVAAIKDFFSRYRKFWEQWYPTHETEIEHIYETVIDQTPAQAKDNFEENKGTVFVKLGSQTFLQREQAIINNAYKIGGVKSDPNISIVFNPILDNILVPSS